MRTGLVFLLGILMVSPLWANQSRYQRDMRERWNDRARQIPFFEKDDVSRAHEEVGSLCAQAKHPDDCRLRMQRKAVRQEGDAILDLKYTGEILSETLTCRGTLIKWQEPETQSQARPETLPDEAPSNPNP